MSIHTTTHALSESNSDRLLRDITPLGSTGGSVSPHSKARRAAGTVRRVFREINDANAAVDRVNRPWVYQSQDSMLNHKSTSRTAR